MELEDLYKAGLTATSAVTAPGKLRGKNRLTYFVWTAALLQRASMMDRIVLNALCPKHEPAFSNGPSLHAHRILDCVYVCLSFKVWCNTLHILMHV